MISVADGINVNTVDEYKAMGADIATVTISPENTIGSMAKAYIQLPGNVKDDKGGNISMCQYFSQIVR